jgi:peptide/nickel transport system permease protein
LSDFWRRYARNKGAVVGLVILILVALIAATAPLIFPGSPWDMAGAPFMPPGEMGMLLGSDSLGRDVAAGIAHGARVSLLVGAVSTVAALAVGVTLGAIAGYLGGLADDLVMRFTEFFQTIPSFVLAILLVAIFTPTLSSVVFAIAIVSWPPVARVVRAEFLSLRSREFVQAARVQGLSDLHLILREVLPNALPPVIVYASVVMAVAILLESALAFLQLSDPNVPSWGNLIGLGRNVLRVEWYVSAIPGVAILLTILGVSLVGQGLNDALNPRITGR